MLTCLENFKIFSRFHLDEHVGPFACGGGADVNHDHLSAFIYECWRLWKRGQDMNCLLHRICIHKL